MCHRPVNLNQILSTGDDVVRKRDIGRAQTVSRTRLHHHTVGAIDDSVEYDLNSVRPVMRRQSALRHYAVAVADMNSATALLKIIRENFVVLAKDAQAVAADEKIGINDVPVA